MTVERTLSVNERNTIIWNKENIGKATANNKYTYNKIKSKIWAMKKRLASGDNPYPDEVVLDLNKDLPYYEYALLNWFEDYNSYGLKRHKSTNNEKQKRTRMRKIAKLMPDYYPANVVRDLENLHLNKLIKLEWWDDYNISGTMTKIMKDSIKILGDINLEEAQKTREQMFDIIITKLESDTNKIIIDRLRQTNGNIEVFESTVKLLEEQRECLDELKHMRDSGKYTKQYKESLFNSLINKIKAIL